MCDSKTPKHFASLDDLISAVALSMPDEYPSGMARVLAEEMLKNGTAIIDRKSQE